jgi:hypothetical protein
MSESATTCARLRMVFMRRMSAGRQARIVNRA